MLKKWLVCIMLCLGLVSCGKGQKGKETIQIKGSDTMVNLVQAWTERFMNDNPNSFIAVTGGGSGTGIASLINNTCEIAACSRKIEDKELKLAKDNGINPKEIMVALDGIVVAVNLSNPIEKLTIAQVADIFSGKITNWKEIGGNDGPIVVLSREVNSGTHVYFKEHVLNKGEYTKNALLLPSSQAVSDEISQNINAIGYYGIGYINKNQKTIAIDSDNTGNFIVPTIENVKKGKYGISRPLLMYTNGEPTGKIKRFVDFILSEQGQKIVEEQNFVSIK